MSSNDHGYSAPHERCAALGGDSSAQPPVLSSRFSTVIPPTGHLKEYLGSSKRAIAIPWAPAACVKMAMSPWTFPAFSASMNFPMTFLSLRRNSSICSWFSMGLHMGVYSVSMDPGNFEEISAMLSASFFPAL